MNNNETSVGGIICFTMFCVFFVMHYGKAALDGIFKRKMRFYGFTSWDFSKQYELEGKNALLVGTILFVLSLACAIFFFNTAWNQITKMQ